MKYSIYILLILIAGSCGQQQNANESKAEKPANLVVLSNAQMLSASVTCKPAELREMPLTLSLNGKIDVPPQNIVSVSMPLGGFLKSTHLLPGMHVKKGEMIAVMEDQQFIQLQQDYLTAKAKLVFLESEYNRQKELNLSKASSDKQFQQCEMDYRSQQIVLSALSEKLKLINIEPSKLNEQSISRNVSLISAIDGFVSKVNVNIGKYVSGTEVLFELINPSDIHLNLQVFEKDVDKVAVGQKVLAYNNNSPDKKYPCEIILVSRDLSNERSAEIHCHFEAYDHSLLPGMYMNAEVSLENNKALALPESAFVSFSGKDHVFLQTATNTFEMLEVEKGVVHEGYAEIKLPKGRSLNEKIVVTGAYSLLMQLKNKAEE